MAEVHYSSLAAKDLYETAEFISRDKPNAAFRWIESIERSCEFLAANPEVGQQRETSTYGRCRSFVSGNFVIFFRRVRDGVEIIRIIQGSRDIDSL